MILWIRAAVKCLAFMALLTLCTTIPDRAVHAADYFTFITTTDYVTGSSSTISLDGSYTVEQDVAGIHSDAVARYYDGLIYVVNREGADNIQILNPDDNFSTVRQFSVGNSSNPTDIAIINATKAYVTRNDSTELWIVDPSTGIKTGVIDLSDFADSDGIPEMDKMCRVGDYLFVTIQRLDRNNYWLPVAPSYIAVVDIQADTLVDTNPITPGSQSIQLNGTDPASDIQLNPFTGMLYVSCVGYWGVQDCGVEKIDPVTFQSNGYMLTETAAGGDINDVEIVAPDKGYVIISDASFHNVLLSFNPSSGTVISTMYAPGDYVLSDIELAPTGELFVGDRVATNPGIRLYDIQTDAEITIDPIDVGLPPFDITFSVNIPSAVTTDAPALPSLGHNFPNPFNPSTTIPFTLVTESHVELSIYDVTGRLVRTLIQERRPAGEQRARWDGRDNRGYSLPSGIYFARLNADGIIATRKMLLLK
jgi:hypothetical protein